MDALFLCGQILIGATANRPTRLLMVYIAYATADICVRILISILLNHHWWPIFQMCDWICSVQFLYKLKDIIFRFFFVWGRKELRWEQDKRKLSGSKQFPKLGPIYICSMKMTTGDNENEKMLERERESGPSDGIQVFLMCLCTFWNFEMKVAISVSFYLSTVDLLCFSVSLLYSFYSSFWCLLHIHSSPLYNHWNP